MIWNDSKNVLAVQRVVNAQDGKPASCSVLSVKFRDGMPEIGRITALQSNRALDLKVERVGEQVKTFFREEGKAWQEGQTFAVTSWPHKLRVGVAVSNGSKAVFAAHFDEFRVRKGPSWVPLFNGKDLTGWKGGTGPNSASQWKWEENMLAARGRADNQGEPLVSTKTYRDFELQLPGSRLRYDAQFAAAGGQGRLHHDYPRQRGGQERNVGTHRSAHRGHGQGQPARRGGGPQSGQGRRIQRRLRPVRRPASQDRDQWGHDLRGRHDFPAWRGALDWSIYGNGRAWIRDAQICELSPK